MKRLKKARALLIALVIGGMPLVTLATCDREIGYFELFRDDDADFFFDDGYYEEEYVVYDEYYYDPYYYDPYYDCFGCFKR
jgi:hypothetical protein